MALKNISHRLLPELLKSDLNITVISRESSSAVFPDGVKVIKSDYSLASLTKALSGQDAVVSMIPAIALAEQQKVAEAALAAGIKRFIPSEYGSDTANDAVIAALPFFKAKREHLDWLKSNQDQLSWTGIITGPFFDWGFKIGMTGIDLSKKSAILIDGGKTPFTTSTVAQIGRSIVAAFKNPTETANKLVYIESFTTNQLEILASLERVTGDKFKTTEVSSKVIRENGFKEIENGDIQGGGGAVTMAMVLGNGALEDHTDVEGGIWNARLGLQGESLDQVVKEVVQG